MPKPLVIAHRGDPTHGLENSLNAFRLALSVPVDMIEFDVRKGRDNTLYIMHDRDTGRTADRNINIEKAMPDEIARVRLKNGEPIPTLHDVLTEVAGAAALNIEIKSKGAGALIAEHLKGTGYQGNFILSSFQEQEVIDAQKALPGVQVAGVFDTFIPSEISAYQRKGYRFISLNKKTVTRELVALLHDQGIKVYVWTVDDESEMKELIFWDADGIYSNDPARLRKVVG
jgi:glycerophosphoryl diester phosphodiesterase